LETRTTYRRRLKAAARRNRRLAAVALLGIASCAAMVALWREPALERVVHAGAGDTMPLAARALGAPGPAAGTPARRIYRHSVVPGGVANRAELMRVIRSDKVVAQHYAAFRADQAGVVGVTRARAVHVSYRKGDKVYWTAKKVMLAEGETLLSDGQSEIRARCGNRISDVAQLPVEADAPTEEELDASVEDGGAVAVNYAFDADLAGAAGQGYQLVVFPNAAGLAVNGAAASTASTATRPYAAFGDVGASAATLAEWRTVLASTSGSVSSSASSSASTSTAAAADGSASSSAADIVAAGTSVADTSMDATAVADTSQPDERADTGTVIVSTDVPAGSSAVVLPKPEAEPEQLPSDPDALVWPPGLLAGIDETAAQQGDTLGEVPEPPAIWMGAVACVALALSRRRAKRA
jgi:hypothetical protein